MEGDEMKDRKKGLAGEIFLNDLTVDMSGKPYILFILALALGCGENEPRNCVVSEVIRRYGDDIQRKAIVCLRPGHQNVC